MCLHVQGCHHHGQQEWPRPNLLVVHAHTQGMPCTRMRVGVLSRVHASLHASICASTWTQPCKQIRMQVRADACTPTHPHARIHTPMHACSYTHAGSYSRTHAYVRIHACTHKEYQATLLAQLAGTHSSWRDCRGGAGLHRGQGDVHTLS